MSRDRKRAYNTTMTQEVIDLLQRHEDFGFKSASGMVCAAVLAYAQNYQHVDDFDGSLIRAIAREEVTKQVAKLGSELRSHIDAYMAPEAPEWEGVDEVRAVNQHQVNPCPAQTGPPFASLSEQAANHLIERAKAEFYGEPPQSDK